MVPVLRRHRTFRKDGTGRIQHYPQRFHPLFVIVSSLGTTNSSLVSNLVGAGQRKGVFPICQQNHQNGICHRSSTGRNRIAL